MLPTLYRLLWSIAPPLIRRYLRRRAQAAPAYLLHWNERFGKPLDNAVQTPIWVHAVSVGETRAAAPLITELRRHFPDAPLLLTQMTPTGRAAAEALFPDAQCRYLPYDHPDYVAQFFREHRPHFGILMETEIWPNLMHAAHHNNVPLFLANARLSERSMHGYLKARSVIAPAMAMLTNCFAQTAADAERLTTIGAPHICISGNTKYDITPPAAMQHLATTFRQRIGNRPIVVCGSTRAYKGEDEAEMLLSAWQQHLKHHNTLLVIVPRHPERFQAAYQTAVKLGLTAQYRSDNAAVSKHTQVWIGDSMGELFAYYQLADAVFVGGSLVDTGCQNIIEPIACGKAVWFGPSIFNFQATCEAALTANAATQISSADTFCQQATTLIASPSYHTQQIERAAAFIAQHQGASRRIADHIVANVKAV